MFKLSKNLRRLLTSKQQQAFSGGHIKEYDWRDDIHANENLYNDPRHSGPAATEYSTPYSGPADTWNFPSFPDNYDYSNLRTNLQPTNRKSQEDYKSMTFPYWTPDADIAHEVIFILSTIMNQKITIFKQNHLVYNILERKGLLLNGFLLVYCH